MGDALDDVLRLVADGRLRPEEAAPIIDALAAARTAAARARSGAGEARAAGRAARAAGRGTRFAFTSAAASAGPPRRLRVQVRDDGRTVVDLQLPGVLAELAGAVPGIPVDYVDRVARHSARASAARSSTSPTRTGPA